MTHEENVYDSNNFLLTKRTMKLKIENIKFEQTGNQSCNLDREIIVFCNDIKIRPDKLLV